jgi:AAHS family benzoate transporter-like MFS transporter
MQTINLQERIDASKFNRFHGIILFWCTLILVIDGYDLAVFGAALPSIMKEMGVSATTAGFMASAALFGVMIGAMFFGTLADKVGRPKMLVICIAVFSVFTAATGLARDPVSFSVIRFIAGLGIGGVLPICAAQMGEFAPTAIRARLVAFVFAGYPVGGVLVALVAKQLIVEHGWSSVFYVGGLPLLLIPFILKTMPDSVPFLMRKGRDAQLREIAAKVTPGVAVPAQARFEVAQIDRQSKAPIAALFQDQRGFSTVMIWLAFFFGLFMVYALSSWLTKLLAIAGYSLGSALTFVLVFNAGAIFGALGGAWLGDKFNIKHVLVFLYAVGAVSLACMGLVASAEVLFAMVFLVGASTLGTQLVAYAYAAAFYPTSIRSTGVGFASGVGRAGGILAPIIIGAIVALNLPFEQNFMAIGLAGFLGMIAVVLINHRLFASATPDASAGAPAALPATGQRA